MIKIIDETPTKAAKHRLLSKLGLSRGKSYQAYLQYPLEGKKSLEHANAGDLLKCARRFDLLPDFEICALEAELKKIDDMEKAIVHTVPIKTGATWMSD